MHQLHTYSSVTYHNQFILLLLQGSEVLVELHKNSLSGSLMINHVQDEGLESMRTHNPAFSIIIITNKMFYIKMNSVLIQERIRTLPRYINLRAKLLHNGNFKILKFLDLIILKTNSELLIKTEFAEDENKSNIYCNNSNNCYYNIQTHDQYHLICLCSQGQQDLFCCS